ncbi:MAG: acyltransferase [Candidatus Krumholzibacteriota bacterium]|nr:acyltransferase [Candidatus Krumholzibacteriota bacterium]
MSVIYRVRKGLLRWLYKRKFKSCGENFRWNPINSSFVKPESAEIGNNVFIGEGCHISVHNSLKIGDGVVIGPRLIVMGGDHDFKITGKRLYEIKEGINLPVIIGKDVWIGAGVIILKGVRIEEGAVLGAGSLVTKNIPPYTIAVGSPAGPVRKRFSDEELKRHLRLLKYDKDRIGQLIEARNKYFETN